jgi:hypothetical protein
MRGNLLVLAVGRMDGFETADEVTEWRSGPREETVRAGHDAV